MEKTTRVKLRLFDAGLYVDGLKQLRIIGLLCFVILELEAILIPLGEYVTIRQSRGHGYWSGSHFLGTMSFMQMHPLLVLTFCVFTPVMVLYLFSFLNKRNASDFYHSLPGGRLSLFFSFFAAVMTWTAGVVLISSATSLLGFAMLSQYCAINLTSVWIMVFNVLAACVYVAAAVAIAMCLSGTIFTNVVASLLLIFVPRTLMLLCTSILSDTLPLLSENHFPFPLASRYNVATNLVLGSFTGDAVSSFTFLTGGFYTLAVGVIYLGIAAALFRRRKSEAAGQSAPNRVLQGCYRILLSFIVCLIPCTAILNNLLTQSSASDSDLFGYFVCYVGAVVVFLAYELITTRKWKNLMRSLPSLGILLVLNLVFVGGLTAAYYSALSFHPDAEDIDYIRLVDNTGADYYSVRMEDIRLDDLQVRETIAYRLKERTAILRKSGQRRFSSDNGYQTVAIHTGWSTVYRRLPLTASDNRAIAGQLKNNEEVRRAYSSLPDPKDVSTNVSVSDMSLQDSLEIYDTFRQEAAAMDFEEWYAYVKENTGTRRYGYPVYSSSYPYDYPYISSGSMLTEIYVSCAIGTRQVSLSLPITSQFPETANLYMRLRNQYGGMDAGDIVNLLRTHSWVPGDNLYLNVYTPDKGTGVQFNNYWSGEELRLMEEQRKELADFLEPSIGADPDIRGGVVLLTMNFYNEKDYSNRTLSLYLPLPPGELPAIIQSYLDGEQFTYPTYE